LSHINGFLINIPHLLYKQRIYTNVRFQEYEGSSIKKDDEYIESLIGEELHPVTFKYDIWYRGYIKHINDRGGVSDAIIDSNGKVQTDWVVGDVYF